ncbi:hypothetical protein Pla108_35520 [Botrimarina colliarenosi]|uniref:Uncharacterized protein n=1 Tax=Botrimarina colliarenosi TaxID=2528001 RepID=A0A5C6A630_9BACT|nr:hypothetical protein [Botrimarina colliarenosi]TWT95404.1 hypothetical protein Pla108_35520 [Botrimarina colliarenosi]
MPPTSRQTELIPRFHRLVRRLQSIENELLARGESLVGLALQSPHATLSPRTASLLRRMEVIDAELVVIEALLPDEFAETPEDGERDRRSNDLDVGAGPFDLGAG